MKNYENILMGILIIILIFVVAIPNSNAQNSNEYIQNYYNDNYVSNLEINQSNYYFLNSMTLTEFSKLSQQGIDTKQIGTVYNDAVMAAAPVNAGGKADLTKGYQLILEARKLILEARDKIMMASFSKTINQVNSEINNATSIGADTKPAVAKLEEAKRALSKKDYTNASMLAGEAYRLALSSNMGFVSIKDLISSRPEQIPNSHLHSIT